MARCRLTRLVRANRPGSRPTMNDTMQSSQADVSAITQSPQSTLSGSRFSMPEA